MEISEVLNVKSIVVGLKATSKEDVIKQMTEVLSQNGDVSDQIQFFDAVMEREVHATTGVGNGIAIPHGRCSAVKKASIVYAKLAQDIDWESLDEKPVQLVIMLAVPETQGDVHLKILSELAMKLMDEELVDQLKKETDPNEIIGLLSREEDEE
ncbi:PTS sugar transporter subunit IIA [Absicoccus porci]|uniref:PTS sugar transporter subunit IIA n=1 Tax=Absicoccus porci TaxID=2486576 RepID=UPI003F890317